MIAFDDGYLAEWGRGSNLKVEAPEFYLKGTCDD